MLATLADYATVRPGDRVFFFANRLIYGIGRVIDPIGSRRGAFLNYPGADHPQPPEPTGDAAIIGPSDDQNWLRVRIVVPFVPDPYFFAEGIDMDEVLAAPGADVAWGLRFFHRVSFKQLGEAETRLLIQVFERRFGNDLDNKVRILEPEGESGLSAARHGAFSVTRMITAEPTLYLNGPELRDEEALHGLLIEELDPARGMAGALSDPNRLDVFHELAASPPKPPVWADAMDVVGTRSLQGRSSSGGWPSAVHYRILEAKKGAFDGEADDYDQKVAQLMKYVDFVAANYAGGNYAAIDACYVASSFAPDVLQRHRDARNAGAGVNTRAYVLDPHETNPTHRWDGLRLLRYAWNSELERLTLSPADS